jgi:hypothetical protein
VACRCSKEAHEHCTSRSGHGGVPEAVLENGGRSTIVLIAAVLGSSLHDLGRGLASIRQVLRLLQRLSTATFRHARPLAQLVQAPNHSIHSPPPTHDDFIEPQQRRTGHGAGCCVWRPGRGRPAISGQVEVPLQSSRYRGICYRACLRESCPSLGSWASLGLCPYRIVYNLAPAPPSSKVATRASWSSSAPSPPSPPRPRPPSIAMAVSSFANLALDADSRLSKSLPFLVALERGPP